MHSSNPSILPSALTQATDAKAAKGRGARLLQLALAGQDKALLGLLLAQPRLSAQGAPLHEALGWLELPQVQRLVAAGASINQRASDGSLLTHKVCGAAGGDARGWWPAPAADACT